MQQAHGLNLTLWLLGAAWGLTACSVQLQNQQAAKELAQARSEGAMREALIEQILQHEQGALGMPAWQAEPQVQAHIIDLYANLSARAQGTQGLGRPPN